MLQEDKPGLAMQLQQSMSTGDCFLVNTLPTPATLNPAKAGKALFLLDELVSIL
jgi:hypothetical protein